MTLPSAAMALMLVALALTPGVLAALTRPSSWRWPKPRSGLAPAVPGHASVLVLAVLFLAAFGVNLLLAPGFIAGAEVLALAVPLFALAALDARYYWLPDSVTLPLLAIGLVGASVAGDPWDAVAGAALWGGVPMALSALHDVIRKEPGFGMGDMKLMAAMGAWLGLENGSFAIAAAAISAFAYAGLMKALGLSCRDRRVRIPFGSILAVVFWAVALFAAARGT